MVFVVFVRAGVPMEATCKIGSALIIVVVFQLFVGVESGVNVNTRDSRGRFFGV